jgi:hypothetical protein
MSLPLTSPPSLSFCCLSSVSFKRSLPKEESERNIERKRKERGKKEERNRGEEKRKRRGLHSISSRSFSIFFRGLLKERRVKQRERERQKTEDRNIEERKRDRKRGKKESLPYTLLPTLFLETDLSTAQTRHQRYPADSRVLQPEPHVATSPLSLSLTPSRPLSLTPSIYSHCEKTKRLDTEIEIE